MAFHLVFLVLAGLAFFSKAAPPDSADSKHPLFIRILDSVRGIPAPNVPVKLYRETSPGSWQLLNSRIPESDAFLESPRETVQKWLFGITSSGLADATELSEVFLAAVKATCICTRQTNDNGELHELTSKELFVTGTYKIEFDTASYWKTLGLNPFHHHADVVFTANDAGYRHYSITAFLSPFSYSTAAAVSEPVE